MRNATEKDLENGYTSKKVMYLVQHAWFGPLLAHIKQQVAINGHGMLAMETADGCPIIAEYEWLRSVPRKQGSVPKPKKPHVRGTKPWLSNCVPYDPKLIKVGTRVKCRDKEIRTVRGVENGIVYFDKEYNKYSSVFLDCGLDFRHGMTKKPQDIMKIVIDVPVEKKDKHNGYEVGKWHFWEGKTSVPPVDGDVKVLAWIRCYDTEAQTKFGAAAKNYLWKTGHGIIDDDIIAFKIIE